jgi:hypothetical protein
LDPLIGQNNIWMRFNPDSPWVIDLTIGGGNPEQWIYRRDPNIGRNWNDAVLFTSDDVPYLAPDLQLLFKSKDPRPKDDLDARIVVPLLNAEQHRFLRENLDPGHSWLTLLAGH